MTSSPGEGIPTYRGKGIGFHFPCAFHPIASPVILHGHTLSLSLGGYELISS